MGIVSSASRVCASVVVLTGILAGGCHADLQGEEPQVLTRLTPTNVSGSAWSLFDRSTSSTFTPTADPVHITLGQSQAIAAIKIFGAAPYRLTITGSDGSSFGPPIDLSKIGSGWHAFPAASSLVTSAVDLRFEQLGGPAAAIPEIELWSSTPADTSVALPADLENSAVEPSECVPYDLMSNVPPTVYRHAYVTFNAQGVLRGFALRRSVNGLAQQGGAWLASSDTQTVRDEIDPSALRAGDNTVQLCSPNGATQVTTVSGLRLLGELDDGNNLASAVTVGDGRDGSALVDRDDSTTMTIAANERVLATFDRLISPDAIALTSANAIDASADVACLAADGTSQPISADLESSSAGAFIKLDSTGRSCAAITLSFSSSVAIGTLNIIGSGVAEPIDWPRVVIASAPEHFGDRAWVGGFVARPATMTGTIRTSINGEAGDSLAGDFGVLLTRGGDLTAPWQVAVSSVLPNGSTQGAQITLTNDQRAALLQAQAAQNGHATLTDVRFGKAGDSVVVHASATSPSQLRLGTRVGLNVPAGALGSATDITLRHLASTAVPPLDTGMVNVTAPKDHGFEFLPHGQHFAKAIDVAIPYDTTLIPTGMTENDVHTYYFDVTASKWKPLTRTSIDVGEHVTHSATDHFTIMIDAVLAVPQDPTPLSFDPTAMSSIGAASPAANIDLIEPPTADSTGDAKMSLPIRVPKGRGAYTPSLAISYSSSAGNGWLGVGWDLHVSRVEIDTRWGVPRYTATEEPRYLLDGAELLPTLDTDGPTCSDQSVAKRYHARIEGSFAHILRCGSDPASYHWEVHDRDGTLFVFGTNDAAVANPTDASYDLEGGVHGVFRWFLAQVVDVHGNTTTFHYQADDIPDAEPAREVYPSEIDYTQHPSLPSAYSIVFDLDDGTRPDAVVSGRSGWKMVTRHLLRAIHVRFRGQTIRDYVLTYAGGEFDKSVLTSVATYGTAGCAEGSNAFTAPSGCSGVLGAPHTFEYFNEPIGFDAPVAWNVASDPAPQIASLNVGQSQTASGSIGAQVGPQSANVSAALDGTLGSRGEVIGMYDVNGDGLVDQVFSDAHGNVTALLNQTQPGITNSQPLFAPTAPVSGMSFLGIDNNYSVGVNAALSAEDGIGATVSGGFQSSTSRAGQLLTDIDGDGFLDVAHGDGTALTSQPCNGGTCFTPATFGTPASINPNADPLLNQLGSDIAGRTFNGDPVIQWTAPFDGTIIVQGTIEKAGSGGSDGVVVEAYHDDDLIQGVTLAPNDTSLTALTPTMLSVTAGDAIYLRVRTGADDGIASDGTLLDLVHPDLQIQYLSACTSNGCNSADPNALEPTGNAVFSYDSPSDFRIAGQPSPIVAPTAGMLELHAVLQKQPTISNLRMCVQRFASLGEVLNPQSLSLDQPCDSTDTNVVNLSGTMQLEAASATTIPIDESISVSPGEYIMVRVESALSFDPQAVSIVASSPDVPIVAYSQVCLPDEDTPTFDCSSDPAVTSTVQISTANFGPFVPVQAMAFEPIELGAGIWTIPSSAVPSGPFVLAVRSPQEGVLLLEDCTNVSCDSLGGTFATNGSDSVTIEVATDAGDAPTTVELQEGLQNQAAPVFVHSLTPAPTTTPFAGGYRQFRAGIWNENEPFAPTAYLQDLPNFSSLSSDRQTQVAQSFVTPLASFGGATVTSGAPAWIAPASAAFVSAQGLSAAPVGVLAGSTSAAAGGGLFANNYMRLSGTRDYFVSASLGVQDVDTLSGSLGVTRSTTDTTTDAVDMNGDGVLDVIKPDEVTLTAPGGNLVSGDTLPAFDADGTLRHRFGLDYSIQFGGKAVVPTTTSSGRDLSVDNSDGPPTGILGLDSQTGFGVGRTETTKDLIDVNGDGLPDEVTRQSGTISVCLNLGARFGTCEPYGTVDPALEQPIDTFQTSVEDLGALGFSLDSSSDALSHETTLTEHKAGGFDLGGLINFSHSTRQSSTRVTRQLADINGDGLPDLLFKRDQDAFFQVQINRGNDFAPAIQWPTTAWPCSLESFPQFPLTGQVTGPDVVAGTGLLNSTSNSGGVVIPIIPNVLSLTLGGGLSNDTDTYELGLVDIDGDGTADHVLRRSENGDSHFYVKHNLVTGKANLLHVVHRPLGGTVTADYTRLGHSVNVPQGRQVLTSVTVDDGVDLGASFASPNLVTTIAYANGVYARNEKEFFGFGTVTTTRADGVAIEHDYETGSYALHGLLKQETRRDGAGNLFHQHTITRTVLPVLDANGAPVGPQADCVAQAPTLLSRVADACTPLFPVITEDDDTLAEGGPTTKTRRIVDNSTDYDRFGNVLASTDFGDDAIATDDLFVQASYLDDTSNWILGRATSLQVTGGGAGGTLLRSRTGEYNSLGDLTSINVNTGSGTATTTLGYDVFGNMNHLSTPPNEAGQSQTFDLTFDPDVATYAATTTDGFGYVSSANYDVRFGVATTQTDVNNAVMTRALDTFGRIVAVNGPYDTTASGFTVEYHPEESPPRAVTTMHPAAPADYTGPIPAPTTTVTFVDGLGETIEQNTTSVVDAVAGMTTAGLVARDALGRIVTTQNPFFTPGASTMFVAPQMTLTTTRAYDTVDRPVLMQYSDGATETASFDITTSPAGQLLFLSRAIDPNGHARETYRDQLNRTRAYVEHPAATSSSVTSYDYLATGELSAITDAEGNQTTLNYDLRGLRTSLNNLDEGLIENQYDLMGNRIALIQPNERAVGTRTHYIFDHDRLATVDYPTKTDVTFTYGAPGAPNFAAARITQITDETGIQTHEYGALGEVRRTLRTVIDTTVKHPSPVVFDLHLTTDSFGRQLRVGYPDGEVVTNAYDASGKINEIDGAGAGWSRTYASDMRYDVFGNRTRAVYGNGDTSTWTFDPARIRLTSLSTTLSNGTPIQALAYTYDPASNPLSINNNLPPTPTNNTLPGTATQSFSYDGVDQLLHATGAGTLNANKTTTYDMTFAYTASHNIAHKTAVHQVINNGGNVSLPDATNYDSAYSYTTRPHLATTIGSLAVTYDPSGNPLTRTTGKQVESLTWDDDNRMAQVNGAGVSQQNVFDASGLRVIRNGQDHTIFSSALFDFDTKKTGTKHVFAGSMRVASIQAAFSGGQDPALPTNEGTAYFFHENHLGSTGVVTTENGDVNDAHEYFPDGADWIDSGKSSSVDGYLFSGTQLDADTGFYDFGQRFYDPKTSIWLGNDRAPLGDPKKWIQSPSLLATGLFSAGNPERYSDSFGQEPYQVVVRDFTTNADYKKINTIIVNAVKLAFSSGVGKQVLGFANRQGTVDYVGNSTKHEGNYNFLIVDLQHLKNDTNPSIDAARKSIAQQGLIPVYIKQVQTPDYADPGAITPLGNPKGMAESTFTLIFADQILDQVIAEHLDLGDPNIVEKLTTALAYRLVGHEWGHSHGLCHDSPCNSRNERSEDEMMYRSLNLHDAVSWHKGQKLTDEDIKYLKNAAQHLAPRLQ